MYATYWVYEVYRGTAVDADNEHDDDEEHSAAFAVYAVFVDTRYTLYMRSVHA